MNVLFVCTANAGRSVLSERLFQQQAEGRHQARSAGSNPGSEAHPEVVDALREIGIDASDHTPQKLTEELIDWSDVVVATCDESCPYVPGKRYRNWHLSDPRGKPIGQVRVLRDDIARRVEALVRELDAGVNTAPRGA